MKWGERWSRWEARMEKRVNRLEGFLLYLILVAFGAVILTGAYLWVRDRFLFWWLIISVPLAFLLKKKLDGMVKRLHEERRMQMKRCNSSDGKVEDDVYSQRFRAMSNEELLKLERKYKDTPDALALIDDILEERREETKKP